MRVIVKQLNLMLDRMMDKNYQLLAAKDVVVKVNTVEKQIEIVRAQIQNNRKVILSQDVQLTTVYVHIIIA